VASLDDLRLADLLTFLAIQRTGSVTSAAREREVTPSQVSKAIARLEFHCGERLCRRSSRGVKLTDAGHRVIKHATAIAAQLRAMRPAPAGEPTPLDLTVAGPSYVLAYLLPVIATCQPGLRVRGLELPPSQLRAYISDSVFDVALVAGQLERRPQTWTSDDLGTLRFSLFGPPEVAKLLAPFPTQVKRVRELPFVGPLSTPDRFVPIGDDCPLGVDGRNIRHEVQTIGSALELASRAGMLVFGPVVAARKFVALKSLVEIPVEGWEVMDPFFLMCNGDRVLSRVRTAMIKATKSALEEVQG
jgi:DNA-binding transcriptional LysR family regulator